MPLLAAMEAYVGSSEPDSDYINGYQDAIQEAFWLVRKFDAIPDELLIPLYQSIARLDDYDPPLGN